jgi:hypothetical protein
VAHHAVETGTALEIDADPDRQDLDVERLRVIAREGAWVSIGTDAHTPGELVFLEIGGSRPRSSPASPASAYSTSFQRASSPNESVSFVQRRGASGTKGARHGTG